MLTQLWADGLEHVIAYATRALKPNEKNNGAYLFKLAAAAWAIDHFSVYLLGRQFSLHASEIKKSLQILFCMGP